MSDQEIRLLARLASERDLAAAERLVAILRRDLEELDLPRLDPGVRIDDVPFRKFGFSAPWWGRVRKFVLHVNYARLGPDSVRDHVHVLSDLAVGFRGRERRGAVCHRDALPDAGALLEKIDRLLRAAGL